VTKMDTCMSTSIYPSPGGDEDATKVWYPLSLSMEMGMNLSMMDMGMW